MFLFNPIMLFAILVVIVLVLFIAVIIVIGIVKKKKMYFNVEQTLKKYVVNDLFSLKVVRNSCYDYILDIKNAIYYIKVIPHFSNDEICVNNRIKWQIRNGSFDDSVRMVDGIEPLMNMPMNEDNKNKKMKKLYIVYPSARVLLKYINECEMEFIYPDTDVYGANIVNYSQLLSEENIIK